MASSRPRRFRVARLIATAALGAVMFGCERNDMHNQPRHEPMEGSGFFDDGQSSRPIVAGTIARGQLNGPDLRISGIRPAGVPVPDTFPFEITKADLLKGQERFNIYCGVCHGATGDADGMVVKRGFVKPPSFHDQRLKDAPAGHFFDVMTNGWGAMYSYSDRITPEDRWRIAAYIRVLQLSQNDAVASAPAAAAAAPTNPQQPQHQPTPAAGQPQQPGANQ